MDTDILEMVTGYGCRVFEDEHFVYKSLKHGPAYINVDPILYQPWALYNIGRNLAEPYLPSSRRASPEIVEVVADPAVGGISFGLMTAHAINERIENFVRTPKGLARFPEQVMHIFCEKEKVDDIEIFEFLRTGFMAQCKGKRVLIVEDILNSGESTGQVISRVREAGGEIVGVSCLVSRGGATAESLGVPRFDPLIDINMLQYEPDECPLCAEHVPMVVDAALGKGKGWADQNPNYPTKLLLG